MFRPPQLLEGGIHISGVPEDDSVYNQAKGSDLVFLPFAVALSKLAPLAMEDRPREGVASLATIELSEDSAPVRLVVDERQFAQVGCRSGPARSDRGLQLNQEPCAPAGP